VLQFEEHPSVNPFADAVGCWQRGDPAKAEALCQTALERDPAHLDAQRLLGEILAAAGRTHDAILACQRVTELAPHDAANLRRLGQLLSQAGEPAAAATAFERALTLEPDNPRALNNLGNSLTALGRPSAALRFLERALELQPDYPIAHNNLGNALARTGNHADAIRHYERAIVLRPDFHEALLNLARALVADGRLAEGLRRFEQADALRVPEAEGLSERAELHLMLGLPARALELYRRAAGLAPAAPRVVLGRIHALMALRDYPAALAGADELLGARPTIQGVGGLRAAALLALGRAPEALEAAGAATRAEPEDTQAWVALGFAAVAVGQQHEALAALDRALELQPAVARAHEGRARALAALGRAQEALAAYARANELNPAEVAVPLETGNLLMQLGRSEEALAAYRVALGLQPQHPSGLSGTAMALMSMARFEEARPWLGQLRLSGEPVSFLPGYLLFAQLHCCDWSDFDAASRAIVASVERGERADLPFSFTAHNRSLAAQRRCAEIYVAHQIPPVTALQPSRRRTPGRLRIGYLSPDFRVHPVAQLMAGVLENHDRGRFETYAFSAGGDDSSELRRRLEHGCGHFEEVAQLSDAALAARIAELGIDIVVDLAGHTTGSRTPALAYRPAPLQISWLGFPGTLGSDFIDYLIADRQVIPESDRIHYAEQVIYLPDCYLPGEAAPPAADPPSRAALGLPPAGVVYCCFNTPYKILPDTFATWMRILKAVPGSVLWLRAASATGQKNLSAEAARSGIDPARLVFAPLEPSLAAHQARLSAADLFLDTQPFNAHVTALDALRAGVPVLTTPGMTFCSRVATSLLGACGLMELSVATPAEYEHLAVELGRSPERRAALKARLRRSHATAPLFDPARFCRNLERAFTEAWARYERGDPPSSLSIDDHPVA
jgi:protein O-GlcNAc transferase